MKEKQLVKQLKRQNEKALTELVQQYSAYISTIVRNIGRNVFSESDVEEIAADVFIAVWNNADKLRTNSLRSYLGTIARNTAISRLRQFRYTLPIDELQIASDEDIEAETERKLLCAELRAIVSGMEQKDKEVLLRFYFYYQHIPQIAEEMQITDAVVKTRLHRARKKLLERLKERGYEHEA